MNNCHKAPAIEMGDVTSVLQLGQSEMGAPEDWTQQNSDTIGQFLQVWKLLAEGSWQQNKEGTQLSMQGGEITENNLPSHESTVFALVYFRQLIQDQLFDAATKTYAAAVDDTLKKKWVEHESQCFHSLLDEPPSVPKVREADINSGYKLVSTFCYGARIIHPQYLKGKKIKQMFQKLYEKKLGCQMGRLGLDWLLTSLMNHVQNVGCLLHYDFAYWLEAYSDSVPKPDVLWQWDIFSNEPDSVD